MSNNIQLIGFDKLDLSEINSINEIISKYIKKINSKIEYDLLRLTLKQHQKIKYFIHEINAELFITSKKKVASKYDDKNIYRAVSFVLDKLLSEIERIRAKKING